MNRRGNRTQPTAGPALNAPRIWAVGGGKGGVGKSIVASSLACAMAGAGRRCALVDADLGGANLHTLLDVPRPRRSLSHFLGGDVESLAEVLVPTSVPNLSLVSGSEALLDMANPNSCRKEKLFRHIRALDVDEVLLDLGGGSAFNVLDSFLLAARGIVVVTPEPTAIENAEHFLRAALHRALRTVARHPEVRAALLRVREDGRGRRFGSARELIAHVKGIDPIAAKLLEERADAFTPLLVVNQAEGVEHRRLGPELAARCRERLGVSIDYAARLDLDRGVREAVARRRPVHQLFSHCSFSRQIETLAQRLLREQWQAPHTVAHLPALDLREPGAYLRRCRRQLGLSLREMTERTRIQGLDDIERERFDLLPPEPYLKGFVLEYARELGVQELGALTASYLDRYRTVDGC